MSQVSAYAPPTFCFRVTKYDPSDRDGDGSYVGAEDVTSDHAEVEAAYLDAVTAFASDARVTRFSVREPSVSGFVNFGVEAPVEGDGLTGLFAADHGDFHDGAVVSLHVARELVRAMLRDNGAWCRLEVGNHFWVHIGYDQYLYISSGSPSHEAIAYTQGLGLFVERIDVSPYRWRPDGPPALAADEDFWNEVKNLIQQRGPLLLEEGWVHNLSRWHRLDEGGLSSVKEKLGPRSRLSIWPNLSGNVAKVLSNTPEDHVQVIWEDHAGEFDSRYVDPESWNELTGELAQARAIAVMSTYEDEARPILTAVLPDPDGVLRARWTP